MLRLPKFELHRPTTVDEVVGLLAEHGEDAQVIAGGTDLVPNMKHELFTPGHVVALGGVEELRGIRESVDGGLAIGAMTTLEEVAGSELVQARAPALAQAASLVAGPQLRTMGTLGGNVMLDTRCQWYNQTHFWRQALGYCLKKDGTVCHVVAGGKNCVAAASNDSAPALMSLGAMLAFRGADGSARVVPIDELWSSDGIWNKRVERADLLVEVRTPPLPAGHRGAYGKLRDRGSIDFPLLGVAARLDVDGSGVVERADLIVTALAAKPLRIKKALPLLVGADTRDDDAFAAAVEAAADACHKQCHPLPNIPGDPDYREAMTRVYARRTLHAARDGSGPVHHV